MINSTSLWCVKHRIKTDVVFIAAEMAIMIMFTMMNVLALRDTVWTFLFEVETLFRIYLFFQH